MASTQRIARSYIEWAPIIGGAVLACAASAVFLQFGGAIGFTTERIPYYVEDNIQWRIIIIGMWLLWVQLLSSMLGGYIAGRLREPVDGATAHESEVRDGIHGLMVWATATLMMVLAVGATTFLTTVAAAHGVVVKEDMLLSPELAHKSGVILGFLMAASSLASAVAAWYAGTVGGDHRDTSFDLSRMLSFKNKK